MVTALWVLFDLVVVWRTDLMSKPLSKTDKVVLVVIGFGVAVFGGVSEWHDSQKMDSLMHDSAYNAGQLTSMSKMLGHLASASGVKPDAAPATVTVAALTKIDQLQKQLAAVKAAEHRHLSPAEKVSLQTVVREHPDVINGLWIMSYPDCFDCRAYAWEFAETINAARTDKQTTGVLPYPSNSAQLSTAWRGLIIGSSDPKHLTQGQEALANLLNAAHLPYTFEHIQLHIEKRGEASAVLFVAPSPG